MLLTRRKDNLRQEYLVIGVSIAIGIALVLGFYGMFLSVFRELGPMSVKIKKAQTIIPDVAAYRGEREKLEAQMDSFRQQIAQSKKRLFWKKDVSLFLAELSHIAEQLAIDFISIKPSLNLEPIRADDEQGTILMFRNPVNIAMKVGHRELIDFLKRIERSDKFLRVDDITIAADTQDIFKRDVQIVLSVFSAD